MPAIPIYIPITLSVIVAVMVLIYTLTFVGCTKAPGIFQWYWRFFAGDPEDPVEEATCAHEGCDSRIDPRCKAENCTNHCAMYCDSVCITLDIELARTELAVKAAEAQVKAEKEKQKTLRSRAKVLAMRRRPVPDRTAPGRKIEVEDPK